PCPSWQFVQPTSLTLWIVAINPGTILFGILAIYTFAVLLYTGSIRNMVVAFIACLLTTFVIMTYFATFHRGPNWAFYWWPGGWTVH
ncbi:hypothetical protein ACFL35_08450, partial [Candidatus Riflebacteria bacterium]